MTTAESPAAAIPAERLRIALLTYRGKEHCGGQGIYVRNLSRELVRLGHRVTVIGGQPYPVVDDGVELVELPSLDLYRDTDPFRVPHLREFRDAVDVLEFATMCTAGFPEPLTFSLRALRYLREHAGDFDIVHDNQTLGYGMLGIQRLGLPLVTTIHHPITVDYDLSMAGAGPIQKLSLRRWYGFLKMQGRVARRVGRVITVSGSSCRDIVRDLKVDPTQMTVVPVGIDPERFRPAPRAAVVDGGPRRLVTTASADVPLKGLIYLLEALAKLRTELDVELVVIGKAKPKGPVAKALVRLELEQAVRFASNLSDQDYVDTVRGAEIAVVPSLYEGFSLPAIEAMACGVPLVATTGGALPEVAGTDGETALLVPPGDEQSLAAAIRRLLLDDVLRTKVGRAGRERVLRKFTWASAAASTAEVYRDVLGSSDVAEPRAAAG